MGFTYVVLNPSMATADSPLPGVPLVLPSTVSTEVAQVINPGPGSSCPTEGSGVLLFNSAGSQTPHSRSLTPLPREWGRELEG